MFHTAVYRRDTVGVCRLDFDELGFNVCLARQRSIERDELNLSRREFRAFDGETCEAHKISILKDETIATVIYDDEPGSGVSLRTCVAQGLASGAKFSLFATQDSLKNAINANAPRIVALIWDAIFRIFARI